MRHEIHRHLRYGNMIIAVWDLFCPTYVKVGPFPQRDVRVLDSYEGVKQPRMSRGARAAFVQDVRQWMVRYDRDEPSRVRRFVAVADSAYGVGDSATEAATHCRKLGQQPSAVFAVEGVPPAEDVPLEPVGVGEGGKIEHPPWASVVQVWYPLTKEVLDARKKVAKPRKE